MGGRTLKGRSLDWYILWFGAPVLALLLWWLEGTAVERKLEFVTVDWRFAVRADGDMTGPEELVVIGVQEADLTRFGRWPWTRKVHTALLELLAETGPGVVALDFLFTEKQRVDGDGVDPVDEAFGRAAEAVGYILMGASVDTNPAEGVVDGAGTGAKRVVSGYTEPVKVGGEPGAGVVSGEAVLLPVPELAEASYLGFVNMLPSADGVWRRLPLVVRVGDDWYPSLVTQTLMLYWGLSVEQVRVELGEELVFERDESAGGEVRVPIGNDGMMLLNWRGWWQPDDDGDVNSAWYSYSDLIPPLEMVEANPGGWFLGSPDTEGKIVLVGQTAEGLTDIGASPLDRRITPGIMTHATAIENIVSGSFLREVRSPWFFLVWAVLAGVGLRLTLGSGAIMMWVLVATVCLGYVGFAFWVFSAGSLLVPLLWPLVGTTVLYTVSGALRWHGELAAKRAVREVFAKIVPPQVMEELIAYPESIDLIGRRRAVATLFSDIRSFTTISEGIGEEALVEQLNEYFEAMVGRIDRTGGTLSKYIGDAIMAVWGDVTEGTPAEQARGATRAALGMQEVLAEMNPRWEKEGKPAFYTGIGINFGEVMVGYIGSKRHREFTVIGDAVNTAARLEGLTKGYGAGIAVGESVRDLLDERFVVRTLGLVVVKGKTVPVRVFEVLAEDDAVEAAWAGRYEEAFERYLARDFAGAVEGFEGCLEERPGDLCCETYASACRAFEKRSPGEEWDGVVVMTSK
ncbi:MAG: adenylate/guanylate cyclase domain-containing protein [Verrucomicrobiales bacterium]|nr:adenylate/guanylate cyclase domain-containing protein [Verrucomicrobiales bacterium]